tara:strand:- start:1079 stop:2374 length:1296 start_codon:yes stop_codon:yes gene_type:complete
MIELLNIILSIAIFFGLSFFSFFLFTGSKINKQKFDIIDITGTNFIILLNTILLASLINPNKEILFFFCTFVSLLSIAMIFKRVGKLTNKIIYFFLFFFVLVVSIDISNNFDYSWDTKKYYLHKATGFYENFFIDDFSKKSEYPHFASYIWAFFWKNNFLNYEYTGRLVFGYIYILSIFYFVNSFNIEKFIKIFFSILLILLTYKTNLFDGRPDILIFSFYLFLAKYLFEIFHKNNFNLKNILLTILTLNLILWTKTEGLVYSILICLTLVLFVKKNQSSKILFCFLIFLTIAIKYITYHYYGISLNPHEDTFGESILSKMDINFIILRSWQIISWYVVYFLTNPIIIISLLSLIIIWKRYKKLFSNFNYLYFFFVAKFSVLFLTYFVTSYPMPFQVKYSLDRIILHSSGLFLIIVYFCIVTLLKDKKIIK